MPSVDRTVRPDLAAVDIQSATTSPTAYLADLILPPKNVMQKIGNQYYQSVDSDQTAQTGRTLGAAPSTNTLASVSDTYNCAEAIWRVKVPDDEIFAMGGLQGAQEKAARIGKRTIMRAKENALVALLSANAGATADILDSLRQRIDVGMDAIQRVAGSTVLVCGFTTYRRMTRYSEVTNTLLRTGIMGQDPRDVRFVNPGTLASVLGVEQVMVGDDDHWTAGEAYLLKLPDANVDPTEVAQIGRTIQFLPDGNQPFLMESYYDNNLISEVVDTRVWYDQEIYNGSGIYKLTGIDEGNAVTTTTA